MIKLFRENLGKYIPFILANILFVFLNAMAELALPNMNADITNIGIANGDIGYIVRTGALMLVVLAGAALCSVAASYFSSKTAMGFGSDVRRKLFCHVETLSKGDIDEIGTASLITRATNDVNQVQNAVMMILRMMLMAPVMCIGGIVMAYQKSPGLSLIILGVLPILALLVIYMMKKGMPLFKVMQKKIDRVNQVVRENLNGIRVIRAFNKNAYELERFDEANRDLTETALKVNRLMAMMMPIMMLVVNLTNVAVVWFGGHTMLEGGIQVGDLTAFITYIMLILMSFMMSAMLFVMLPRASASADRINEVLEKTAAVHDREEPAHITSNTRGSLVFDHVSFSYPGAEAPVLTNISFEAKKGEVTAIIGGTGSGKSSVVHLIPRFYDVSSGSIQLDGVDIRALPQEELRRRIGLVPQKAFLFSGTIADNIRYGKEDATEEEIFHALSVAQAMEFVSEKEDGIETYISQGGTNVSGGQKQRLAIARALVRKPEVYLFDDSFSALDFKTDAKLRAALKEEIKESTMLVVAQRVSSILDADRILVLDDGEIVGAGTHKELLETCSVYQEIVKSQLSESEVA